MKTIHLKRIYDLPEPSDGVRILVDRLWPRSITRYDARIDFWMKDVAPSLELRRWFRHDQNRWAEFRRRYLAELRSNEAVTKLQYMACLSSVSLLYGAPDPRHNNAAVLASFLKTHHRWHAQSSGVA